MKGEAKTPLGQVWEMLSDASIDRSPASNASYNDMVANPWIESLHPSTPIHDTNYTQDYLSDTLGFSDMADALRTDMASGKLRPEQLNKVSIEDAVRRAHQQRLEGNTFAEKASQSIPKVREYPEGYAWHDLTHEDPEALKTILKKEGETMQNCIGGYCNDVLDDGTKLYSLRDPAGNPHANVEVTQNIDGTPMIKQIKGKQNEAPNETYQPYVQDFIKNPVGGQNFSVVGDLENSGLLDINRLKQHGLMSNFDQASQDVVNREIGRIHPKQPGKFGGFESSGQYGSYVPNYDLLKNLTQDFAGNYATPSDLMSHLQGKEARPVEESYSNFYDQPK